MVCGLSCVDDALTRLFYKLGVQIGKRPGYFIIIPVLLAGICVTGYQRMDYEVDPEYLFSPVGGKGKFERLSVEENFPLNYSYWFNIGRITRPGRFGRIIAIPRDKGDMMRVDVWQDLLVLDKIVQNISITWDGRNFTYADVCAKWDGECFQNDILNLSYVMQDIETKALNLTFPIMLNPVTWEAHAFPLFFGGALVSDIGTILEVPSVQLVYAIATDTKEQDARGAVWEAAFLDAVEKVEDEGLLKYVSTSRFASRTLDVELNKNTMSIVPFFSVTFVIMILFSTTSCMMSDCVRSKPWLGILGTFSACIGTVSAFGFVIYCGVQFIGMNLAAPFLMLGIGMDDTFVMLASWRRSSIHDSIPERLGRTMSDAAVSITITSLTDMLSFWVGVITPFPSVKIFCTYTGFAVCFTYFFHITFFAGCLAIAGFAEKKNLHSVTFVKVLPKSMADHRSRLYRIFSTGGVSEEDPYNPRDNKDHSVMVFFRDRLATWLNYPFVKVLVLVSFVAYLAVACWAITDIQEGLERRKLSRYDSYSIEFYNREDHYFREYPYRIQVVINGHVDYSDPVIQNRMEELARGLENTTYISSPLYTESWIRSFLSYVRRNAEFLNLTISDEASFIRTLKDVFLASPNPFSLDVRFNEDESKIIASRFLIQAVNISNANHEKEMVADLRRICDESPMNASVFHPYFVFFDQFLLVRSTSIQCVVIAAIVMMIISLVFIPNALCCLWVAFSIISIFLGVVGYMTLWGVSLDTISMINLIMCIGFSVDFSAHICYAYISSKAETPEERVRECLYALGMPILQGALSTIFGVLVLAFAPSYIFLTFFKTVFLVILFGALHGLFLLPVLLSLFDPNGCCKPSKKKMVLPPEKQFPHPFCIPHPTLHSKAAANVNATDIKQLSYLPTDLPHQFFGSPQLNSLQDMRNGNPNGKIAGSGSGSLEKDLGLGTSGEDSSESSSSKSQRRKSRNFQPSPMMEMYNNQAYLSDEDLRDRRYPGARHPASRNIDTRNIESRRPRQQMDDCGIDYRRSLQRPGDHPDRFPARYSAPERHRRSLPAQPRSNYLP